MRRSIKPSRIWTSGPVRDVQYVLAHAAYSMAVHIYLRVPCPEPVMAGRGSVPGWRRAGITLEERHLLDAGIVDRMIGWC